MPSPYKGKTGLRRLIDAFGYSITGLRAAYRLEDAFRQEILLAAVLIPAALLLPVAATARGDSLLASDAHGHEGVAAAAALQFIERLDRKQAAGGADRMARRDGAAVGVGLRRVAIVIVL